MRGSQGACGHLLGSHRGVEKEVTLGTATAKARRHSIKSHPPHPTPTETERAGEEMEDCHQVLLENRCVSVAASDPWRSVFVNSPGVPGLQRLGAHQLTEGWLFMARKTPAGAAQWGNQEAFE